MIVLTLGSIELINAYRVQTKLSLAAGQLAELIAAQSSVTEGPPGGGNHAGPGGTLGDMCTAVADEMLPYDPTKLIGWLESSTINSGSGNSVPQDWVDDESCPSIVGAQGSFFETITLSAIATAPDSMFTQDGNPSSAKVPGYSAISVELFYPYNNVLPFLLSSTILLTAVGVARPRSNATVKCTYSTTSGSTTTTTSCPTYY